MVNQKIIMASEGYPELEQYIKDNTFHCILLVCDNSMQYLKISEYFNIIERRIGVKIIYFSDFKPNPLYESVVKGLEIYHKERCDTIIAVGGGSVMDVAKCIKLYANMYTDKLLYKQTIIQNDIKLLVIPTTAGSGSEATRFAVIYHNGEKLSIYDDSCIPSTVVIDASALKTLPMYQRKSTMLDAFCHAIESFWSINSTDESKQYSREAIRLFINNKDAYINNEDYGNANMLKAANFAGKAINITQTTAGHAMCYKLTSLYSIAHGHAVALCLKKLWPYMINHIEKCIDPRGCNYLTRIFDEISDVMETADALASVDLFIKIFDELNLGIPEPKEEDYEALRKSVNQIRLNNNPVKIDSDTVDELYHQILRKD